MGRIRIRIFDGASMTTIGAAPIDGGTSTPAALPANRLEGAVKEKVELNLSSVLGVLGVRWVAADSTYEIAYKGPYSEIDALRKAVVSEGVACEVVSPLEIVFRPRRAAADPKALTAALGSIAGVHLALPESGGDFRVYATVEFDLELLSRAASKVGVTGDVVSHEVLEIRLKDFTLQKRDAARAELRNVPYVLRWNVDSRRLWALCVKGKVTREQLGAALERCGFAVEALP
jgi:hypothetical protein